MNTDEMAMEVGTPKKRGFTFATLIKIVALSISVFIYAFFIFRLCTTDAPDAMTKIFWNDTTRAAYTADPVGFVAYDQLPDTYITPEGTFWITDVVYIPAAKQLQLTVKYNDSTLTALKKQLKDEALVLPDEPFDYSFTDNSGDRYAASIVMTERKQNYNYRRIVCEGIDMEEITDLYIDMYYVGQVDYTQTPFGSLKAWDVTLETSVHNVKKDLPDDLK